MLTILLHFLSIFKIAADVDVLLIHAKKGKLDVVGNATNLLFNLPSRVLTISMLFVCPTNSEKFISEKFEEPNKPT